MSQLDPKRRVVVTGLGVVSSIGIGWEEFWKNLLAGKSGIDRVEAFNTADYDRHLAGEVKSDFGKFISSRALKKYGRATQMVLAASRMALNGSGFLTTESIAKRTTVAVGTTTGEIGLLEKIHDDCLDSYDLGEYEDKLTVYPTSNLGSIVGLEFGFFGRNIVFGTACSSGNYAVGFGFDEIHSGCADYALVGGADGISRIVYTGFGRLKAIASEKCQPFDLNRQGMIPGEGAGMLFLENLDSALARKAPIFAEIVGCGMSCDGHHMTNPDSGSVAKAMTKVLNSAGLKPEDIDYISAHGTGTVENDRAECAAYHQVFGGVGNRIPMSSIKSMLGHTMGAASALESIACCLAIKDGQIPPTINFENRDPFADIDMVPNHSYKRKVEIVLNNSQAFGGNNSCAILRRFQDE